MFFVVNFSDRLPSIFKEISKEEPSSWLPVQHWCLSATTTPYAMLEVNFIIRQILNIIFEFDTLKGEGERCLYLMIANKVKRLVAKPTKI